ncbi:aryl hydrocarbon receptor-like [Corythoichthys intestinalis]|uniref:aryl hydrocarbon receptor-like n=1 Tax=Corythoichthys intestinalis TaxID=161448 RepID=UPI0025A5DC77|nr:aryl hydrocarbon receptor-like [Corythoichthys intestinalis]
MQGNVGVYAVKRRKKPVQKNAAPPPVKTNPSKRHRDRLNVELERLTSLLPFSEDVRNRLDKLSVLRLSVGYLKAKSYFHGQRRTDTQLSRHDSNGRSVSLDGVGFSEGELLLKSLHGFVLVVTGDGTIFYTSPTIQDYLGFHQSDLVQQSVYDLIHIDDREMFSCQLKLGVHLSEPGEDVATTSSRHHLQLQENSFFLERSFCCRLRCLLDNTSGFLALKFSGHLKYMWKDGGPEGSPLLALFAIATPVQPPAVMEIRTRTLIFQTKHRMDFAPMAVDTRGKLVLGFSETELITPGSGYQFVHAADMMYCADNHLKMIKTGDSGFTFFRLLTKAGQWLWVQATAHVVFKDGRPDFIIARQKPLSNEEGEEYLQQRRQQLPFNLATGEGVLYDLSLDDFTIPDPLGTEEPLKESPVDPSSVLGSLHRQDHSLYSQNQVPAFSQPDPDQTLERAFSDSRALLSVPGQVEKTGGFTSDPMLDSLEQILGRLDDSTLDGLEVEQGELRDWENALLRMNQDRAPDGILASDVFSYVEEALGIKTSRGESSNLASPYSWQSLDCGQQVLSDVSSTDTQTGHWLQSGEIANSSCRFKSTPLPLTVDTNASPESDRRIFSSCMYEHLEKPGFPVVSGARSGRLVYSGAPNPGFAMPHAVEGGQVPASQMHFPTLAGIAEAGAYQPDRAPENGMLQSSFFCWNGESLIPKAPLNQCALTPQPSGGASNLPKTPSPNNLKPVGRNPAFSFQWD